MDIDERRRTALHEAGHAVMMCRVGVGIDEVSIAAGDGTDGYSQDVGSYSCREDAVLVYLAGFAALAAIGEPNADSGCEVDFEYAETLIEVDDLNPIDTWKAAAVEIMREPRNIRAVECVAERLLECGRLDGASIQATVDLADGL